MGAFEGSVYALKGWSHAFEDELYAFYWYSSSNESDLNAQARAFKSHRHLHSLKLRFATICCQRLASSCPTFEPLPVSSRVSHARHLASLLPVFPPKQGTPRQEEGHTSEGR